jgi:hypothetical protein
MDLMFRGQKIQKGWLFVEEKGSLHPFYIKSVGGDYLEGNVWDLDGTLLHEDVCVPDHKIVMDLPDMGMVDVGDGCVWYITKYVKDDMQRDYSRSFKWSRRDSYMYVSGEGWIKDLVDGEEMCASALSFAANRMYESNDAIIDRDMAVLDDILWFRLFPIGNVENKEVTLHPGMAEWSMVVRESLEDNGYTILEEKDD